MKSKHKRLPPHSWEAHPKADKKDAHKQLTIVVVAIGAIVVLALLLFLGQKQFAGKAFFSPAQENSIGVGQPAPISEGEDFFITVETNIKDKEIVGIMFELDFPDGLECIKVESMLGWESNDEFSANDEILSTSLCDNHEIVFEHATTNYMRSRTGVIPIAKIYFKGAPSDNYDLKFDVVNALNLADNTPITLTIENPTIEVGEAEGPKELCYQSCSYTIESADNQKDVTLKLGEETSVLDELVLSFEGNQKGVDGTSLCKTTIYDNTNYFLKKGDAVYLEWEIGKWHLLNINDVKDVDNDGVNECFATVDGGEEFIIGEKPSLGIGIEELNGKEAGPACYVDFSPDVGFASNSILSGVEITSISVKYSGEVISSAISKYKISGATLEDDCTNGVDLKIGDMFVYPKLLDISFDVVNVGDTPIKEEFSTEIIICKPGTKTCYTAKLIKESNFSAGGVKEYYFKLSDGDYTSYIVDGKIEVVIIVDRNNQIAEVDEINNVKSVITYPSISEPVCGNSIVESDINEICDGTVFSSSVETCIDKGFLGGTPTCTEACTSVDYTSCQKSQEGEECALDPVGAMTSTCAAGLTCEEGICTAPPPAPVCGNNQVELGEACDNSSNPLCIECKLVECTLQTHCEATENCVNNICVSTLTLEKPIDIKLTQIESSGVATTSVGKAKDYDITVTLTPSVDLPANYLMIASVNYGNQQSTKLIEGNNAALTKDSSKTFGFKHTVDGSATNLTVSVMVWNGYLTEGFEFEELVPIKEKSYAIG